MDLFDDGKKPKSSQLGYQSYLPGQSLETLTERLDYDLKLQVMSAGFSQDVTLVYQKATLCFIVMSLREAAKNYGKYTSEELKTYDDSSKVILRMMSDPQQPLN